jgi:hypothetical protein
MQSKKPQLTEELLEHSCGQDIQGGMVFKIGNYRAVIERLGPVFAFEPKATCLFQGDRTRTIKAKLGDRLYIRRSVEIGMRVGRG